MSGIQFGQPLAVPSKQTLLPIIESTGRVSGFFPIASTTFNGTETSFALASGDVTITTVTLPPKVMTNVNDEQRVEQWMGAFYDTTESPLEPWRGYSEWVDPTFPNTLGYYAWWSMPTIHIIKHFSNGAYIDSLIHNMGDYVNQNAAPNNPPPDVTDGTIRWATVLNEQSFEQDCSFIDFNWITLFQAALLADPTQPGSTVVPLSISTVSNPPGGFFKASVLQGSGGQVILPGGGPVFNTIRILRLQDPPAGPYVFNFEVTSTRDNIALTSPVTLTMTVV